MQFEASRRRWVGFLGAIVIGIISLGAASASAVTFQVQFTETAGTGPSPSGTITFDDVGDTAPSAFSFTDGTRTWTEADTATGDDPNYAWNVQWSSGVPTTLGSCSTFAGECTVDATTRITDIDTGYFLDFEVSLVANRYNTFFVDGTSTLVSLGTYAVVVPEPAAAFMIMAGCVALALRRQRASFR